MASSQRQVARAPSWLGLVLTTLAVFLVVLAFLVGRVRAGADPGLNASAAKASGTTTPRTASPAQTTNDPYGGSGAGGSESSSGSSGSSGPSDSSGSADSSGSSGSSAATPTTGAS
jgi:hypothetical protein